jgi:hypothetical protein
VNKIMPKKMNAYAYLEAGEVGEAVVLEVLFLI